jgi:hypothetical protein
MIARRQGNTRLFAVAVAAAMLLATPTAAEAYIGPGAGFAFVSSFFISVVTGLLALFSLAMWPVRAFARYLRRGPRGRPKTSRLIILIFNSQSADVIDRQISAGKLAHLCRVVERGSCARLQPLRAPASSTNWSAFSTGAMRSAPAIDPFWIELGRHGVWSTVLNVPVPLPPRRFHGVQLASSARGGNPRQAAPMSQPASYAWYLTKRVGQWGTRDRDGEQQAVYRAALDRFRSGMLVSVFDAADTLSAQHDALIGQTLDGLESDDVLIVMLGGVSSEGRDGAPGFIISNRGFGLVAPASIDIAPTVLDLFGIDPVPGMEGRSLFRTESLQRMAS